MGILHAHEGDFVDSPTKYFCLGLSIHRGDCVHNPSKFLLLSALAAALLSSCGDDSSPVAPPAGKPAPVGQNGITVLAPNGGETFQVGGEIDISWQADTTQGLTSAKILVDCGSGDWFSLTGPSSVPYGLKEVTYDLPDSVYSSLQRKMVPFTGGTSCKLKIQDYTIGTSFDVSDAVFTIKAK